MQSNASSQDVVTYHYPKCRYIRLIIQTVIIWCVLCVFIFLNYKMEPDIIGYLFLLSLFLLGISPVLYFNLRLPQTIVVGPNGLEFCYKRRTEQLAYGSIESISELPPSATILRKFPYSYMIVEKSGRKIEISSELYPIEGKRNKDFLEQVKRRCPTIKIKTTKRKR